jgi:hypothetical protein
MKLEMLHGRVAAIAEDMDDVARLLSLKEGGLAIDTKPRIIYKQKRTLKYWNAEEDKLLLESMRTGVRPKKIARDMDRTLNSVISRFYKLKDDAKKKGVELMPAQLNEQPKTSYLPDGDSLR